MAIPLLGTVTDWRAVQDRSKKEGPGTPKTRSFAALCGWVDGTRGTEGVRVEGVSQECRAVASAGEGGKGPDTPPIQDTLDRNLDRSKGVDEALAEALAKAAGAGRYDVVLQLARKLEPRPVRDLPRLRAEDDLAVAVRLATEAGEWAVVSTLSRQLEALRREREGGGLRVIEGGSGAAGSGER